MKSGGWTQAESYRDLIKDKDVAVSLEQENRMFLTGDSLDQQIAVTYERYQAEPENVDVARRLGSSARAKGRLRARDRLVSIRVGANVEKRTRTVAESCRHGDETLRARDRGAGALAGRARSRNKKDMRNTRRLWKRRGKRGPRSCSTTPGNGWSETRRICNFASSWASICSAPDIIARRCRNCSGRGKIQTRG